MRIKTIRKPKPNAKFPNKLSSFEFYNVKKLRKYVEDLEPWMESLKFRVLNLLKRKQVQERLKNLFKVYPVETLIEDAKRISNNSLTSEEVELFYIACKISGINLFFVEKRAFENFIKSVLGFTSEYKWKKVLVFLFEELTKNKERWNSANLGAKQEEIEDRLVFFERLYEKFLVSEIAPNPSLFEDLLDFAWKNLKKIQLVSREYLTLLLYNVETNVISLDDFKRIFGVLAYCSETFDLKYPGQMFHYLDFIKDVVSLLVNKYIESVEDNGIEKLDNIPQMLADLIKLDFIFFFANREIFNNLTKLQFDTLFNKLAKTNPEFVEQLGKKLFEEAA